MAILKLAQWFFKGLGTMIILVVICVLLFITYRGNQPMSVLQTPKGMTYWQFMADRLDAAKTIQPSRCGWGMLMSLATLGPVYSVVYTSVGVDPEGFLAKVTAPDPDIPKNVVHAAWYQIPDIWWKVVERLSWTMLARPGVACRFRPVKQNE
jgi:hypothetical protein